MRAIYAWIGVTWGVNDGIYGSPMECLGCGRQRYGLAPPCAIFEPLNPSRIFSTYSLPGEGSRSTFELKRYLKAGQVTASSWATPSLSSWSKDMRRKQKSHQLSLYNSLKSVARYESTSRMEKQ